MSLKLRFKLLSVGGETKDLIKTFTSKVPMEYKTSAGKKSRVQIKQNFNLADIPISSVVSALDDIKKNPTEVLPQILEFNRPVSPDYFQFIREIRTTYPEDCFNIWNSVHKHLLRALVCSTHNLESSLPTLVQRKDSSTVPYAFIEQLPEFCEMAAKMKKKKALFLHCFLKVLDTIVRKLGDLSSVRLSIDFNSDMLHTVNKIYTILRENTFSSDVVRQMVDFSVSVLTHLAHVGELQLAIAGCLQLVDLIKKQEVIASFSDESLNRIVRLFRVLMDKSGEVTQGANLATWNNVLPQFLKAIVDFSKRISDEDVRSDLALALIQFVTWMTGKVAKENLPPRAKANANFEESYDMKSLELVVKKVMDPIQLGIAGLKACSQLKSDVVTSALGVSYENICSIVKANHLILIELTSRIASVLSRATDPCMQLFTTRLMKDLSTSDVTDALEKANFPPHLLVNDLSMSEMAIKSRNGTIYADLHMAAQDLISYLFSDGGTELICNLFLTEAGKFLMPDSPSQVSAVITTLRNSFVNGKKLLASLLAGHPIMSTLIDIDLRYKQKLLSGQVSDPLLPEIRCNFVHLITLLAEHKEFCNVFFAQEKNMTYVRHLLLEEGAKKAGIDIVSYAVRLCPSETVLTCIKDMCANVRVAESSIGILCGVLGTFKVAFNQHIDWFCKNFISCDMLDCITEMCLRFAADKSCSGSFDQLLMQTLTTLLSFCRNGHNYIDHFCSPRYEMCEKWTKVFGYVPLEEKHLDMWASLAVNSETTLKQSGKDDTQSKKQTLVNTVALRLLFSFGAKSTYRDSVYSFLEGLMAKSVENRWHCYNSGFLLNTIENTKDDSPYQYFKLIRMIGTDFCGTKELDAILQILMNTKSTSSIKLLETSVAMVRNKTMWDPNTRIGVEYCSTSYYTPAFNTSDEFKLSFSVKLEKIEKTLPLFVISTPHEEISVCAGTNPSISYIRRPEFTEAVVWNHTKKMNAGKWNTIVFSYSPSLMSLTLGQNGVEFKLEEPFTLTGSPVVFDMVCRTAPGVGVESVFVANSPRDSLIHNLSVPYPIGFCDVMPIAGGTKCLLPFLNRVGDATTPSVFFYNLLELISLILPNDRSVDKLCIRTLSHLLKSIKKEYWEEITVALIGSIAAQIKDGQLHQCFASNLLLDFEFWLKYPVSVHNIAFVKNVVESHSGNKELFRKSISFGELMTRYYMVADSFTNSAPVRDGIFNFLAKFSQESLTEDDAFLLLGFFFQTKNLIFAENCGRIIYNLLNNKNAAMSAVIERNGGYRSFLKPMGSGCLPVMTWALQILFVLVKNNSVQNEKDTFQESVLLLISIFSRRVNVESFLPLVISFIMNADVDIKAEDVSKPLKYTALIPFLVFLLSSYPVPNPLQYLKIIFNSLKLPPSRSALLQLKHWYFWLFYVGLRHNLMDDVMKVMGLMFCEIAKKEKASFTFTPYYNFLAYVSTCYKFDWDKHMASLFTYLIEEKAISSTLLTNCLTFISYDMKFPETRHQGTDSEVMTFYADLFVSRTTIEVQMQMRGENSRLHAETGPPFLYGLAKSLLSDTTSLFEPVAIGESELENKLYVIALILELLSGMDTEKCDEIVSTLIAVLVKKGGENKNINLNPVFYLLSIKQLSEKSRNEIRQYVKDKAAGIDFDKTRTGIRKFVGEMARGIAEQLSTKDETLSATETWIATMLHPEVITDLATKTWRELTQNVDSRKANDALNVKQNERAWHALFTNLTGGGGIWSKRTVPEHWEVSPQVDVEGRKYLMKANNHFNNHLDASKKRDSEKTNTPTRTRALSLAIPRSMTEHEEASFNMQAEMVTVKCTFRGTLQVFNRSLAFESRQACTLFSPKMEEVNKLEEVDLSEIVFILKRRYLHEDRGCELFTKDRKSYLFVFLDNDRNWFLKEISRRNPSIYIQNDSPAKVLKDFDIVRLWQHNKISNYEYLYWLNMISGRSFHDLSQYPVYPWVLSNYASDKLDLKNRENYRDLSKPIGTLNRDRLEELKTLYDELEGDPCRCHYRVFYSSSATVVNYLIRCEPFTTCHISLQSGAFDVASRIITSVPSTWNSVISPRPDFRELIPEFFTLPNMFRNENHFDLGLENSDMELPPWAPTPEAFVSLHRAALESPIVSHELHEWVDLIFGYKSRGKAAVDAINDFHPFSYSECLANKAKYEDRACVISEHAATFGVAPQQIFTESSPKKTQMRFSGNGDVQVSNPVKFAQGPIDRVVGRTSKGLLLLSKNELYIATPRDKEVKLVQKVDMKERYLAFLSTKSHTQEVSDAEMVVAVAPWSSYFVLFATGGKVKEIASGARHPGIIGAFSVDSYSEIPSQDIVIAVGTVSKDCSFFIWQARIRGDKCYDVKMCSSMEHKVSIVDIAVSVKIGMVATVDESPQLVLTRLSGQFYRSLKLGTVPFRVEMTKHGDVIVFSTNPNTKGLQIQVFSRECTLLCMKVFDGEVASILVREFGSFEDVIVLAFQEKQLALVQVLDLTTRVVSLPGVPVSLYSENCQSLWVCYRDGSASQIKI